MIAAVDPGTAVFGVLCAVSGLLILVFRERWHAAWWRGGRNLAPDDSEFERDVYRWGSIGFGVVLLVLGTGLAIAALSS